MTKYWLAGAAVLALAACSQQAETDETPQTPSEEMNTAATDGMSGAAMTEDSMAGEDMAVDAMSPEARLDAVLAAQSDDDKARYQYRHPKETLTFFGVEPGMTVVDLLPGNPWYSGILIDYLGPDGKVIGADYSPAMWALFGQFAPPEGSKDNWTAEWTAKAEGWRDDENDADVAAVQFGAVPDDMAGAVDVILSMRALHHFNRFEDQGGYMTAALADMMKMLKPGGVVGVVQHRAPEGHSDEWANGNNGYLKQSAVIAAFENAGFELVGQDEINANQKDLPTEEEFVWRLPPTLATSGEDADLRARMTEIGESDRMTLKFRKPE